MDAAEEVCVYAKLPRTFQIPTPVGNYSPDWAIAFYEGTVKHIFFVAETKGTMETLNLRPIEQAKISCLRVFVKYDMMFLNLNFCRNKTILSGYHIRQYDEYDIDALMKIWLDTNIQAHNFISSDYWRSNYDMKVPFWDLFCVIPQKMGIIKILFFTTDVYCKKLFCYTDNINRKDESLTTG